jgi:hypothetical protein
VLNDIVIQHQAWAELRAELRCSIAFRRPDLSGIQAVAIFDPEILRRAVQGDHYRLVWNGKAIRTIGSFSDGAVIDRDQLFADLARRVAAWSTSRGCGMRVIDGMRLYSASDLVNFLGCNHRTALDLRNIDAQVMLPPDAPLARDR